MHVTLSLNNRKQEGDVCQTFKILCYEFKARENHQWNYVQEWLKSCVSVNL